MRILHLEDNVDDADLVRAQLQAELPDCEIVRVENRDDFLAAIQRGEYDLVLSDFSLPQFSGMEALAAVRAADPAAPFFFLSGTIGEERAVQALRSGADDYIIKDRPARLVAAIRSAMEQRREHQLRRKAEQQLREHADLLDKARDAICVTDIEGRISYWNSSAKRVFGMSAEEVHGHYFKNVIGPFNEDVLREARRELDNTGAWNGLFQYAAPDGGLRHIESRWTLVRDASDRPKSILLINTDVTEEKRLEAQLLHSQRLEAIGTLAGGIAHDLNNVLAPILMAVNLLETKVSDTELLRLVRLLDKSARHGADLIRQVLAFARGAEGTRSEVRPALVVRDVVSLLRETLPRSIAIETDIPEDLCPVVVNTTQLSQVLMNLGINARDAMPQGGAFTIRARNVRVTKEIARQHPDAHSGPHVLLSVSDTGTGIAPGLIDRIFDPFFTTKTAGKGTGLGLSTVLGIVKGHGGFLEVESQPDAGTEFRLYFPAVVSSAEESPVAPEMSAPRGDGSLVLIVDDEEAVREVACAILKVHGYRCLIADSGAAALDLYQEQGTEISAVLTDLMMPAMQGGEMIRRLRTINPDVRIVAMSGMLEAGADSADGSGKLVHLAKPMTAEQLLHALQRVTGA